MTTQPPSPDNVFQRNSGGSASDAGLNATNKRFVKWTPVQRQELARLYIYTDLPLAKIIAVIHRDSPGSIHGRDTANRILFELFDRQPRWLHPKSREDMARRVEQLANAPARWSSWFRKGTHSGGVSDRLQSKHLPARLESEGSVSPTLSDFRAFDRFLGSSPDLPEEFYTGTQKLSRAPPPTPNTREATDRQLFAAFLLKATVTSTPTNESKSSLATVLADYSTAYCQVVNELNRGFNVSSQDHASMYPISENTIPPVVDSLSHENAPIRYENELCPLPGDFLNIDSPRECCSHPREQLYQHCLCSAAVELLQASETSLPWVTPTGLTLLGSNIIQGIIFEEDLFVVDDFNNTVVHFVAARGSAGLLLALISHIQEKMPDLLGKVNNAGQNFFHVMSQATMAQPDHVISILEVMERAKVDVYTRDHYGRNIFHMLRAKGIPKATLDQILVHYHAKECNYRDAFGREPQPTAEQTASSPPIGALPLGSQFEPNSSASALAVAHIVALINSACNIDPAAEDSQGRNGLHCLAASLSMAEEFTAVCMVEQDPISADTASILSKDGRDPTGYRKWKQSKKNPSELHLEVCLFLFKKLLERGVCPDRYDVHGNTPLMAFAAQLPENDNYRVGSEILTQLIQRKNCLNARNRSGETALHIAVRCGRTHAVRTLVKAGANVYARDAMGRSVLDVADAEIMLAKADFSPMYARLEACRGWLSSITAGAVQSPTVLDEWGRSSPQSDDTLYERVVVTEGGPSPKPQNYRYPALTRQDLSLLYLNSRYGLGQDLVHCVQMVPDQKERIGRFLRIATIPKTGTRQTSVVVGIDWPLRYVLQSQFVDDASRKQPFSSFITLTGFAADAQALTIAEYLFQTWPESAGKILQLLPSSLDPRLWYTSTRQVLVTSHTIVKVYYENSHVLISAVGNRDIITQVIQAFTWISCAVRADPSVEGLWECIPIFAPAEAVKTQPGTRAFVVHCFTRPISWTIQPGRCWQNMFQGAVLASGFPTSGRAIKGLGLEMPLNMMAELGGSQRVTKWNDKIFIKGFSTMLVAIKSVGNILVWHYLYSQPGTRISYMDCTQPVESVNMARLRSFRHVIGWCSSSMYCVGSPDANYNIRNSYLPRPSAGLLLDKLSITMGSTITGGATFTPSRKELPPHLTRNGTIPKLRWLSKKYVVFWDEEAKRGWVANGTSALLHIVRASLKHYENDDFSAHFMFKEEAMNNLPHSPYKHNTATGVLIDQGNQGLAIYPNSIMQRRETSTNSGSSTSTPTSDYFLFGDLTNQHLDALEQMMDLHSHSAGRDGINLKPRLRKHLEGWDFADLAKDYDPMPRVATIPTLGYGWVDFVRSIGAITLFGGGFGELLKPASHAGVCDRWSRLPPKDYLLAASVADLTAIMEQHGNTHAEPRELTRSVLWHSPADTCAACPCKLPQAAGRSSATACHVSPVQVLLPSSSHGRALPASGQRRLDPEGAVVFGHNASFGYRWPEKGTDEVPAKDFLVPLRNMLPARLFKTQAEAPEISEASDTEMTSRPDSDEVMNELSTPAAMVESPPSLRSSLRGFIPKRRSCTSQMESAKKKPKVKT
ncbi:hypothetical protein LLEC1_05098 [Akanthomyces lecanii]|uniref:Uncharacterized protein n=1 Tax=Cordyceps confragosa TaxID=2714763 RepID=A0A179IF63_CORDF|nr:hypothetical protein LLEC1_05098 [Akanthomyces lecanii]